MKCGNCGHESNKTKLTLSIDRDLLAKGKMRKVNLSELMEQALVELISNA